MLFANHEAATEWVDCAGFGHDVEYSIGVEVTDNDTATSTSSKQFLPSSSPSSSSLHAVSDKIQLMLA